jgi:endonuclease/exonuclease/phosphatase (EEP) superfamily protein YafD
MKTGRGLACWLVLVLLLLLGLGYSGAWLPLGDSLAIFRPQLAICLALTALFLLHHQAWKTGLVALVLAASTFGPVLGGFLTADVAVSGPYTLYQKNLRRKAWPRYSLADEIVAAGADFVTLQEVSDHNLHFMAKVFRTYPYKVICDISQARGVAVLSRFRMVAGSAECADTDGLALMKVILPDGQPLWLVSLHLHWPYPFGQAVQADRVAARLRLLEGPVVLAGDFNMVPWGQSVVQIAAAARVHRLGPYRFSFTKFGLLAPLPIDHVFLPDGATGGTELRPTLGSDHYGIFARFKL